MQYHQFMTNYNNDFGSTLSYYLFNSSILWSGKP